MKSCFTSLTGFCRYAVGYANQCQYKGAFEQRLKVSLFVIARRLELYKKTQVQCDFTIGWYSVVNKAQGQGGSSLISMDH